MKKIIVGATTLMAMAVTFRTVASLFHIESMMTDWHNVDFKHRINYHIGGEDYEDFAHTIQNDYG